ncbi:isopenicillin N synthase family oxygenase [Streptomyces sp. PSKA54]|uniref:Isopenicillin N synthase family oxygenase n=1 Tax=Streptomyces himalayensis subsp. aureolus TaxID=2758039 RepID=A0A7W2HJ71_9ACTN|nr:isopenicillin N synthase family oxygenase [Streptomyces himalayensis]MBA4865816.1 isopenicillin N synthase family oxygenase [Streptomyces himalayensis subsp. aureolus]
MTASKDFTELPVVDASELLHGGPEAQREVAEQLGRAAREVGFMYVSGHGIAPELFDGLLDAARRFFALPHEEKMRSWIGRSRNHRGFVPEGEEVFAQGTADRKEVFGLALDLPLDDPDVRAGTPLLGPNVWPELDGFREATTAYYEAVLAFGQLLFRAFAVALGEEPDTFSRYATKAPSGLRLIHYPYDADALDRPGIGAHTDYECFTLLRPTGPGLEVLNGAGEWIDVPPLGDAFVVNIGDMLELWTNGEFVSTTHRVRRVSEERYSFPLFFNVDYHTRVEPLPRFVTPDRPARPGLVAGEHLWSQVLQVYGYLKDRRAAGELTLPENALALSAGFGRELGD